MRLDHLLSKEHLKNLWFFQNPLRGECPRRELMGGTFDKASFRRFNAQYAGSPVGTAGDGLVGACTLLGPEGPDTLRGGDSSGSFPAAGDGGAGRVPPVL